MNTTVYNQMCEINLLKIFDAIHRLTLLQENRVYQGLDLTLLSGDSNLLDQSGKDGLYHWARSSLQNAKCDLGLHTFTILCLVPRN